MLTSRLPNSAATDGQHAGPVGHVHADVVAGRDETDGRDGQFGVLGLAWAAAAVNPVARGHHEVAHHRRRRRRATGTLAVEHQPPGGLRLDDDGVERPVDRRQRMLAAAPARGTRAPKHAAALRR